MANNDALRDPDGGLWNDLATTCPTCASGVFLYAANGKNLAWIRDFLCSPESPIYAGGTCSSSAA